VGPTQPPIQWVPGALSLGGKARPGRDADHSPPSHPKASRGSVTGPLYLLPLPFGNIRPDLCKAFRSTGANLFEVLQIRAKPFDFYALVMDESNDNRDMRSC
jgi:hypothetical protein